jgi:hypothetical protein
MKSTLTTDQLLAMYHEYKELTEQIGKLEKTQAKLVLTGQDIISTEHTLYSVNKKRDDLSDAMTFDTPRIWIEYKFRAYKGESQPIATMHDLRLHCSKPDYICTKRYTFLNEGLTSEDKAPLSDRSIYPDAMSIEDLLKLTVLDKLSESHYKEWRSHEYHQENEVAAKWKDYTEHQL